MLSKKLLKSYDLESVEQYFDMVMVSFINGQKEQAINQAKKIDKKHRFEFIMYIKELHFDAALNFFLAALLD